MSIIGIDFGSSITKVIEYDNEKIINKLITDEKIPKKVLDEFIKINNINLKNIKQIVLTGVGTKTINENIYDIPTLKVDEFIAIGLGGLKLAKKEKAIIVSVRNWNCFCACRWGKYKTYRRNRSGTEELLKICVVDLLAQNHLLKQKN